MAGKRVSDTAVLKMKARAKDVLKEIHGWHDKDAHDINVLFAKQTNLITPEKKQDDCEASGCKMHLGHVAEGSGCVATTVLASLRIPEIMVFPYNDMRDSRYGYPRSSGIIMLDACMASLTICCIGHASEHVCWNDRSTVCCMACVNVSTNANP